MLVTVGLRHMLFVWIGENCSVRQAPVSPSCLSMCGSLWRRPAIGESMTKQILDEPVDDEFTQTFEVLKPEFA